VGPGSEQFGEHGLYPLGVVQSGSIGPETVPLTSKKSNVKMFTSSLSVEGRYTYLLIDDAELDLAALLN
jgi:hypothetical protein